MQNFEVTNKEHYGMLRYFWSGQLLYSDPQHERLVTWLQTKNEVANTCLRASNHQQFTIISNYTCKICLR